MANPSLYDAGGKRLRLVFAAVLVAYAIAFGVGGANGHFGWWGEERIERELREQALARLGSTNADAACAAQAVRLQTTFGTISRVSFVKDLHRPLPAIVAQQRIECSDRDRRVTERWILLVRPDDGDAPPCLALGPRETVETAIRRCGFVARRFS